MEDAKIMTPPKASESNLFIQREYVGLKDIEPYDVEQELYKGKLTQAALKMGFGDATDRDWIYFSRAYDPDRNDMDKIWKEIRVGAELTGEEFVLVPGNKIKMVHTPASIIKLIG